MERYKIWELESRNIPNGYHLTLDVKRILQILQTPLESIFFVWYKVTDMGHQITNKTTTLEIVWQSIQGDFYIILCKHEKKNYIDNDSI